MDYKAEKIKPYNDDESKTGQVRQMFDSIAPAYDFMNRAMTMGIDKIWRHIAVKMLKRYNPVSILDVATGTWRPCNKTLQIARFGKAYNRHRLVKKHA